MPPSPKKFHRASLTQAFQNLEIPRSTTNPNISRAIRQRLSSEETSFRSYRAPPASGIQTSFTIAMDGAYDYNMPGEVDPDDLYEELFHHTREILDMMQRLSSGQEKALEHYLAEALAELIFGSNAIEAAGAGYDVTLQLCKAIFCGQDIPDEIGERSSEYETIKKDLLRKNLPSGTEFVLRSRREIVQHAKAASFMINEVYLGDRDFTEDIILQAHRILTYKVDTEQGISWTTCSGVYRRDDVCAGLTPFPDPMLVPSSMRSLITSLNNDLQAAKRTGKIDPVALSAKYCHKFVNIHPFLDGNGRMCRLILNTILLKYGGNVVIIGEQGNDRDEYLGIAAEGSMAEMSVRDDSDEDEYQPRLHSKLQSFTLKHLTASMKRMADVLKRSRGE